VGSADVVVRDPWQHGGGSICRCPEGLCAGPFARTGLDRAFRIAVGAGRPGVRAFVLDPRLGNLIAKGEAAIGRTVIAHDSLDWYAVFDGLVDGAFLAFDGRQFVAA